MYDELTVIKILRTKHISRNQWHLIDCDNDGKIVKQNIKVFNKSE